MGQEVSALAGDLNVPRITLSRSPGGTTHASIIANLAHLDGVQMRSSGLRLLGLIGLTAAIAACSDSRNLTTPAHAARSGATRQLLSSPAAINVVTRNVPLAAPETASAMIDVTGGSITLPGAGLTVIVPPFAVTTPTLITVTAVAGREVAYEFEPHGTQFPVPLAMTQDLSGTSASGGLLSTTLSAGYFQDVLALNQLNGTALVSELFGTSLSVLGNSVSFSVGHFSGYLIGTYSDSTGDGGSQ